MSSVRTILESRRLVKRAPATHRLQALTGLRLFAALAVYLCHTPTPAQSPGWLQSIMLVSGRVGVAVFFILSGFILTINYLEVMRRPDRRVWWRFAVARFARIYPLYLLILLVLITKMRLQGETAHDWLLHTLALQAWDTNGNVAGGYNGPAWSVSAEFFFYACFPLLIASLARLRSTRAIAGTALILLAAMTAIVVSFVVAPIGPTYYWLYQLPLARLADFVLGMLVARLYLNLREDPALVRIGGLLVTGGVLALILLMTHRPLYSSPWGLDYAWVIPGVMIVFGLAIAPQSLIGRMLSLSGVVFLGEASYALYMCHKPILGRLGSSDWKVAITPQSVLLQVLVFALIISLAIALHLLVERPARRWIRLRLA